MIPVSNCRISVVLMSDCTTVKTRQIRTYSRQTCPEFYVINPWPAFSRYNVASKQQQRVALVLLITCLDNKKKKRRRRVWSKSWLGKRGLYGLPVLQRELEVILLFEFKHPISLQAASFLTLSCDDTSYKHSFSLHCTVHLTRFDIFVVWSCANCVIRFSAPTGSWIEGDVTLQESVWNLLTLPEFNRRKKLIATAINRLSVDMSNQRSKTTDFSLGLQESFRIFKISLRRPNRGQNRTVWAGLKLAVSDRTCIFFFYMNTNMFTFFGLRSLLFYFSLKTKSYVRHFCRMRRAPSCPY